MVTTKVLFMKKNKEKNKHCYVLASGPSIKNQDLSKLKGLPFVSFSNSFVHHLYSEFDVKYHLFPFLHNPITEEMGIKWFKESENIISKNTKILIHHTEKKIINQEALFSSFDLSYYDNTGLFPDDLPNKLSPFISLSQAAMQVAVHVCIENNLSSVVMLGIDHSWVNHPHESRHFYNENESVLNRMGYNEWYNTKDIESSRIMEYQNLIKLDSFYKKYYEASKKIGITIYNGTPGSMIKSLPTIDI